VNRLLALSSLALALLVPAGCKQPTPEATTPVGGSSNVTVRSSKVYRADMGATDASVAYYIVCEVTFTNTLGHDVYPEPKNFVFFDAYGQPYPGIDSGSTALIGISNYSGVVKTDAKQDYTIGFRVPSVTSGAVYYAAY
jgi:hypothetical protein